jgi:hypothetical protein
LYVDEDNDRARLLYELNDWKATGESVRGDHGVLLRCGRRWNRRQSAYRCSQPRS